MQITHTVSLVAYSSTTQSGWSTPGETVNQVLLAVVRTALADENNGFRSDLR